MSDASMGDGPETPSTPPPPSAPPAPPAPPGPPGPPVPTASNGTPKWYEAVAVVIIALICCWPLGLILTWLNKQWSNKTKWIITSVIIGLMVIFGIIAAVTPKNSTTSSSDSGSVATTVAKSTTTKAEASSTTTTAKSTTTTTAKSTTTVAASGTIYEKVGSGTSSSPNFTVPKEWQIQYTYDCSGFLGGKGNFIVTVNGVGKSGSNMDILAPQINQLGAGGTDTVYAHNDAGVKNLEVISECNWAIKVVG